MEIINHKPLALVPCSHFVEMLVLVKIKIHPNPIECCPLRLGFAGVICLCVKPFIKFVFGTISRMMNGTHVGAGILKR